MARRRYLDCARGLAVLVMILAHTLDAWTADAHRQSVAYRDLIVLGGFAAPLFLLLAGVGVTLAADRAASRRAASPGRVIVRRGCQVFALAFLFRLQAFLVSPGSPPIALLRVDILNVMGLAMIAVGFIWLATGGSRVTSVVCAAVAAGIALGTPLIRAAGWIDALPFLARWYLRPDGTNTTFTLLPWAGFVFAGACWGVLIAAARSPAVEGRLQAWSAVAGALLTAFGAYAATLPSLYASSSFWTTSPSFFVLRIGVLLLTVAALYTAVRLAEASGGWSLGPLERFGRASLFVYWVHVELVYGYASWPAHRRLPLWGTAAGALLLTAAMYGGVVVKERLTNKRRKPVLVAGRTGRTPELSM